MRAFFVLPVASLFVAACGGTDTNNPIDGGGDGTVNTDGAGMDGSGNGDGSTDATDAPSDSSMEGSSADAGGDAGACVGTWTSCASCLTTNCAADLTACNADNACKNGFTALAVCESMCGQNCIGTFENTGQLAQNVSDCGQNNCNVCNW